MLKIVFLIIILLHEQFECWPDGAPCIHSTFESMNPLEAVEHQGGLQLTPPPYEIVVKQKCYWKGQPIELSLKGKTIKDRFKGFAIQPISFKGPNRGTRIGRFLRLDNNGSWQQQCYRYRNSVTHSHDELKKKMKLWWKNDDDDSNYVQFVATVVKSQKEFWVKSILSIPIPPCHLEPLGMREEYVPPPITPPPPVKSFKLETFHIFNGGDDQMSKIFLVRNHRERRPKPQTMEDVSKVINVSSPIHYAVTRPTFIVPSQRFNPQLMHIESNNRPMPVPQPAESNKQIIIIQPTAQTDVKIDQFKPSRMSESGTVQNIGCYDRNPTPLCTARRSLCDTNRYVRHRCRRTCRFC